MTESRLELALRVLAPLESHRSPLIPTVKSDRAALFGTITAKTADPANTEPDMWYLTNPQGTLLLAFAETAVVSPTPSSAGFAFGHDEFGSPMHPRDAHAFLHREQEVAATAFFRGDAIAPALASELLRAYASSMPPALLGWLGAVCGDYFAWLRNQLA